LWIVVVVLWLIEHAIVLRRRVSIAAGGHHSAYTIVTLAQFTYVTAREAHARPALACVNRRV
jgi:hypothetical protein